MLGLWRWPAVLRGRLAPNEPMRAWALAVLAMGLVWSMYLFEGGRLITNTLGLDRSSKYLLVLLALPAVWAQRPAAWALRWGCWVGAAGAGVLAGWQVLVQHFERAEGANAIQFGNLALLLALWSGIWAMQASRRHERLFGGLAAVLGIAASVLSGSRGGWVTLPVLLVVFVWFARPQTRGSQGFHGRRGLRALGAALLACLLLAALPRAAACARGRAELLQPDPKNPTRLRALALLSGCMHGAWAWNTLGWVRANWVMSKASGMPSRAREMPSMSVHFNHAHNEWLDMFAKRGLLGVGLALFYAVPGFLCGRRLRRGGCEPLENAAAAGHGYDGQSVDDERHAAALWSGHGAWLPGLWHDAGHVCPQQRQPDVSAAHELVAGRLLPAAGA